MDTQNGKPLADSFEDLFLSAVVNDGSGFEYTTEYIRGEEIAGGEVAVEVREAEGHEPFLICFNVVFDHKGEKSVEFLEPGCGVNGTENPDGFDGLPITERLRKEVDSDLEGGRGTDDPMHLLFDAAREYAERVLSDRLDAMEQVAMDLGGG